MMNIRFMNNPINNKLMSNLQIEYGFNVPRNVIYETFVDQMYLPLD